MKAKSSATDLSRDELVSELSKRNSDERAVVKRDRDRHYKAALRCVMDAQLANPWVVAFVPDAPGWAHFCCKPPHRDKKGMSFCSECGMRVDRPGRVAGDMTVLPLGF